MNGNLSTLKRSKHVLCEESAVLLWYSREILGQFTIVDLHCGNRDVISSADAVRLVKRQFMIGRSSQEIADYLCEIALKRHTTDNTACVVVDLLGAEARSTKRR